MPLRWLVRPFVYVGQEQWFHNHLSNFKHCGSSLASPDFAWGRRIRVWKSRAASSSNGTMCLRWWADTNASLYAHRSNQGCCFLFWILPAWVVVSMPPGLMVASVCIKALIPKTAFFFTAKQHILFHSVWISPEKATSFSCNDMFPAVFALIITDTTGIIAGTSSCFLGAACTLAEFGKSHYLSCNAFSYEGMSVTHGDGVTMWYSIYRDLSM